MAVATIQMIEVTINQNKDLVPPTNYCLNNVDQY